MMLEERYNRMMEQVEPSAALVRRTLAATRPKPRQPSARKALLLTALCVLIVALPVLWKVLHTLPEPPRVTSANPTPTFTALPVSPRSDELTLTASDVQWEDNTTLTFLLTMRGDRVDGATAFDREIEGLQLSVSNAKSLDPVEGQPENEKRFQIRLGLRESMQPSDLPEALTLRVNCYTSGNTSHEILHDIDWNTFEYTLKEAGEPIIDLGGDMAITGIGFNLNEQLTVQIRVPAEAVEPTHSLPLALVEDENGELTLGDWSFSSTQRTIGDYIYYTTSMSVTREQLDEITLATDTFIAGETIRGDWSVTVDIPPHPSELPSDELTLTASDAQWESGSKFTFLLTMRGDKVDASTEFDFWSEGLPISHSTYEIIDPVEGQPENEKRRKFILTLDTDRPLRPADFLETLTLRIDRYTSGNTYTEKVHDIDWAAYDGPVERTGTPIIDLGGGLSISGIGFNENGWPTIQVRRLRSAAEPTHSYPIFDHKTDPTKSMGYIQWRMDQYVEGDCIYYNTAACIPREELADYIFSTHTYLAGETIRGDWSVTVDIPPRPAE